VAAEKERCLAGGAKGNETDKNPGMALVAMFTAPQSDMPQFRRSDLQHQQACHRAAVHSGPDKAGEDTAKARRTVKRRVRYFSLKCEKPSGPAP